ncbi:MAG: PDZ domain-containing protein [Planctomycetes bacterium]|nr:PDZ domain-containing protein [Planctomycetota bacterium]
MGAFARLGPAILVVALLAVSVAAQPPPRPAGAPVAAPLAHTETCPRDCPACARAIERGLAFVAARQLGDGGWGKDKAVPVYSLVNGLALLAEGSTTAQGRYRAQVKRFVDWLLGAVPESGAIGAGDFMETWQVAFATLALAAIHQREPIDGVRVRLEGLGRRLAALQRPSGGWFHGGRPHANYSTDLVAATNLAAIALCALRREGIAFDETLLDRAVAHYGVMQNPDGGFSYGTAAHMEKLKRSEGGRTAGALYALRLMSRGETELARKAQDWIDRNFETLHGDSVHGAFPECFWISSMLCSHLGGTFAQRYQQAYLRPLVKLADLQADGRIQRAPEPLAAEPGNEDLAKFRKFGFSSIAYDTALGLLALLHPFGRLSFDPGPPPEVRGDLVRRAAEWLLAERDAATGSWTALFGGESADITLTSLAALAFLAGGSTPRAGPHQEVVARAVDYVRAAARSYRSHWTFQQPFAILLLSEVHRIDPKEPLQKTIRDLLDEARRYQNDDGGWTYGDPRKLPFGSNMASAYCVALAMAHAKECGLPVPEDSFARALAYLRTFLNPDGGFRYHQETQFVSTAGALATFLVAGEHGAIVDAAVPHFRRAAIAYTAGGSAGHLEGHFIDAFALVYGTIAAHRIGGETAARWDRELLRRLSPAQDPAGWWRLETEPRRAETPLAGKLDTIAALFALSAPGDRIHLLRPARPREIPRQPGEAAVSPPAAADAPTRPPPQDAAAKRRVRLALGQAFLAGEGRAAFLARLDQAGLCDEDWIDIAWLVPGEERYLGVLLSRTPAALERMSDAEFAAFRAQWSASADRAYRRWHPLPGELTGYGTERQRNRALETTWILLHAATGAEFLERVQDRIGDAASPLSSGKDSLALLFHPKSGGPTLYGLSAAAIAGLTEAQFHLWRARFLRWVELHVPGQSDVARFATLSDEEFESHFREMRERYQRLALRNTLRRFQEQTGLGIARPRFAAGETAATLAAVTPDSPAAAAGLQAGDTVVRVEDEATPEWDDLIYRIGTYRPGSSVRLEVRRGTASVVAILALPGP